MARRSLYADDWDPVEPEPHDIDPNECGNCGRRTDKWGMCHHCGAATAKTKAAQRALRRDER